MRLYETGFLISPHLSEEEAENLILQMASVVSQKNGKMIKQEKWGKRRLAYSVKKYNEAYYVFFHYEGEAEIPQELARRFRQMDTVLRYLTLKRDHQEGIRKKRKGIAMEKEEFPEGESREGMNAKEQKMSSEEKAGKER